MFRSFHKTFKPFRTETLSEPDLVSFDLLRDTFYLCQNSMCLIAKLLHCLTVDLMILTYLFAQVGIDNYFNVFYIYLFYVFVFCRICFCAK